MNPEISVCVPTYNGAKFLRECLDSILAQTFSQFELLIVDDCSSDTTIEIAHEYASRDPRIVVSSNPQNLGLVGNWNRCIELSKGEWIKFVFQDDLIAPDCLTKLFAATRLGKPIVYCHREFIFESGTDEVIRTGYLTHLSNRNPFGDTVDISADRYADLALKHIGINLVGEPTSVMLHKSIFYKFGCFNQHIITICDFEFYTRIAVNTGIAMVPEVLAQFRIHGMSETANCDNNRNYRAKILDELILIHNFAFDPIYAPMRSVARQSTPQIDLIQLFEQQTFAAWEIAERQRMLTDRETGLKSHVELEKVSNLYPAIANVLEQNKLKRWQYVMFLTFELVLKTIKNRLKQFPTVAWYLKTRTTIS
jgi:glycosyltransferase involved in cell wall biosynthesis